MSDEGSYKEMQPGDHVPESPAPEVLVGAQASGFETIASGVNQFPDSTTLAAQQAAAEDRPRAQGTTPGSESVPPWQSTAPNGLGAMTENPRRDAPVEEHAYTPAGGTGAFERRASAEATSTTEPDTAEGAIADSSPTDEPVSVPPAEKALDNSEGGPAPVGDKSTEESTYSPAASTGAFERRDSADSAGDSQSEAQPAEAGQGGPAPVGGPEEDGSARGTSELDRIHADQARVSDIAKADLGPASATTPAMQAPPPVATLATEHQGFFSKVRGLLGGFRGTPAPEHPAEPAQPQPQTPVAGAPGASTQPGKS
jgi:hypothetical protein